MTAIAVLHWVSGLVVLAEALNKLERTDLLNSTLNVRGRISALAKAMAWLFLGLGAGGAVIGPFMQLPSPSFQQACVLIGVSALIVRTRIKEECP